MSGSADNDQKNGLTSSKRACLELMRIAEGDYSTQIKPRSDKDELGVALFKMTETLRDVATVSQALAVGDYTQKITIKGKDDKLGIAINQMVDSFRDIVHQANKISGGDYSAKIKPRSDKDELGVALFKMTETLRDVANVSQALAVGDYTQKITIKGKDDKLGVAINQMVDSFRSIVHQANKISGGDYSAKIKPRSDKDELGVALFKMTEDLKKLVKKLDQLAYFDPLTHSYTRHYFNAILEKTCAIAARHHRQFAILMLDIDDFKQVNDSFGHDVGDRLLVEFTERLKRNTRDSDFIVRMGGDEFSIIMTEISNDKEAGKLAKQLIRVLSEPYNLGSYCIGNPPIIRGLSQ
ncbi:MAG: diguanylate cyclase [Oleibacter sp.]|nr:diguanylate cyclase [Thalassolituus sp.]